MEKMKKQNIWFITGLFVIGLILILRCFYGVNKTDEAFYVGTAYRFWRGDGMLCDEWMPTQQLCSFWLIPFYGLFRLILGSNDGMVLAFRFLYVAFQLCLSVYLYIRLKKHENVTRVWVLLNNSAQVQQVKVFAKKYSGDTPLYAKIKIGQNEEKVLIGNISWTLGSINSLKNITNFIHTVIK